MTAPGERLDRFLVASVFLHGALFTLVLLSPRLFPSLGANWGSENAGGDAGISVKIVASAPGGIALPAPPVVNETAPANESKGLYKTPEPAPAPPPPNKPAVEIPDRNANEKKAAPPKPAPPAPAPATKTPPAPDPPPNAVPYGEGGRPALPYGQFSTGAGQAGISFAEAAFGERYGAYVTQITRVISGNWLKSMVDSRIQKAPRVYLNFKIAKNGQISAVEVQQSSGIPSLDRSAQRAVLASNPLPPLPADFRGSEVSVNFYFEFTR